MRRELDYFFAALRFFTRLPVPAWVGPCWVVQAATAGLATAPGTQAYWGLP